MKKTFYILIIVFFAFNNLLIAQPNLGVSFNQTIDFLDVVNYNFTLGVKSNIKIKKRFSLIAGLGYGKEKYNIKSDGIMVLYSTYFESQNIKTDCHLRFNIVEKNNGFLFYWLAGPSTNINFSEKTEFGEFFTFKENKIRFYNILIVAGLGFEYKVKNISFNIEPTFETQIWRNRNSSRTGRFVDVMSPYTCRIGINVGVSYFFNKRIKGD